MKKLLLGLMALSIITACATVQSIVRSTLPYTATLIIPAGTSSGSMRSAVSPASSADQIFGGSSNSQIKEVRIANARIEASSPSNQNLGVFSTVRLYLSRGDGSGEVLVASRNDISANAGSSIVLDIDNSRFLDDIIKSSTARVRMEYVLRNSLNADVSVKASLGFTSNPATAQ
ncbi:hypothetical protein WG906_11135 [Pedobacter sp. P351]|uniref:hypothetical protein n=1 Tax=Pedobacter superstes TaxID=3133441 RepID=UPI0030AF1E47